MKFNFWHFFWIVFFGLMAVWGYSWLAANHKLATFVPLGDFVLIALAIMRLVRLFTYDAITSFVRSWFEGSENTFLGSLGTLINCPWCTGLWFSLVVVFCYFATPVAWYAILVLALASVASFLQLTANLIGWGAEVRKKQVEAYVAAAATQEEV